MSPNTPIPEQFKASIRTLCDIDAEALITSLDSLPETAIRINTDKIKLQDADGLYPDMAPVEWCDTGRRLAERPVFTANPLLHAGVFYVQDASSMIIHQIIRSIVEKNTPRNCDEIGGKIDFTINNADTSHSGKPITALDFCAAPGGKTTAILDALPRNAHLVANEVEPKREKVLRENLQKWGASRVITTSSHADAFAKLPPIFDIIAVDAPCSGEGMMRKDEEARRQWTPHLVENCARLQREILDKIGKIVKPGGWLIYSTCTFNLAEDENNARYIRDTLGFEAISPDSLGLHGIEMVAPGIGIPSLRFMPHITRGEGLFIAVFKKPLRYDIGHTPLEVTTITGKPGTADKDRKGKKKGGRDAKSSMKSDKILDLPKGYIPVETPDGTSALCAGMSSLLDTLRAAGIKVTGAGQPAATLKGADFIPDSRFVLDRDLLHAKAAENDSKTAIWPTVSLTTDQAMAYLRREALILPPDTPKGYLIASYDGHPLGLMKNVGNRANNLYPKEWRVLSRWT